jgi:hypothetical protein|tara:strand:+ start:2330 stop:2587 length:258 start_codon:yes stop_codon:yes gene_type:complete
MYVTVIQGKGKIGFLECFEIKDKLKQIGARWHSSVKMWVLTTQDDIGTTMNRILRSMQGLEGFDILEAHSEAFGWYNRMQLLSGV